MANTRDHAIAQPDPHDDGPLHDPVPSELSLTERRIQRLIVANPADVPLDDEADWIFDPALWLMDEQDPS